MTVPILMRLLTTCRALRRRAAQIRLRALGLAAALAGGAGGAVFAQDGTTLLVPPSAAAPVQAEGTETETAQGASGAARSWPNGSGTTPLAVARADLPGFAALERAGATIGRVTIRSKNIFDTDLPEEDKPLFRAVNALHVRTRTGVIEEALLFKPGEPVSAARIAETERLLRAMRYLHDASIVPGAVHDNVVDIEVTTHDTWTLDPGISLSRSGGSTSGGIQLKELNLLGTGIALSYGRKKDVDRTSNEFEISDDRAFGGSTQINLRRSTNSDGASSAATVAHPFYSLDSTWAAGANVSKDDRIDSIYSAGQITSQYRRREDRAELMAGVSQGRVDGWVQRWSAGFLHETNAYALEPGRVAPPLLPRDERLVGPWARYELIEDRFEKTVNRNQIGRSEFFALGLNVSLRIGRALRLFGSTRDTWVYDGALSRGFEPLPGATLIATGVLKGKYAAGEVRSLRLGAAAQLYVPQSRRWLFYAGASLDALTRPGPTESLLLGGDNGLRGYPLRYQSGTRRALLTLEERAYTDWYLYRLFRVGAAAFVDVGRAWGGGAPNTAGSNTGWIGNVGFGLRVFSVRSAFGNVIHLDFAFPFDPDVDVKRTQFLVKTRASF